MIPDEIIIRQREDGTWEEHKPYMTVEFETEEDFKYFEKVLEDHKRMQWIPCRERLPENEQEVEITYVKKHWKTGKPLYFTCRAFYSDGTVNTEESNYVWDETDNWEYIEKMDAYVIPEGWWECVSFAEEFAAVDMPVIAWMPLPEPYELKGD